MIFNTKYMYKRHIGINSYTMNTYITTIYVFYSFFVFMALLRQTIRKKLTYHCANRFIL